VVDIDTEGRRSRLVADGSFLLYADLHNHSLLSDGLGDPEEAFAMMRAAGLDAAALTDHASIPHHRVEDLDLTHYPDEDALAIARLPPRSIDDAGWQRAAAVADAHDRPGEFTALRGFEWTEPWLGHVNVWFSDGYLPVTTPGQVSGLHEWLAREQPDALFGYNHPGREPGRLHGFAGPDAAYLVEAEVTGLSGRMVALEVFNRSFDFLFWGQSDGLGSPVVACLDAGWRPGLIGCSDEHGRRYGLAGRGRTGVWVHEHSRAGLREALLARRCFATREPGLRLDATLDGVRMGGAGVAAGRPAELAVDLAGSAYEGRRVRLQVLGGEAGRPTVLEEHDAVVGEVTRARVEVPEGRSWLLLRVADPGTPNDVPGPVGHPADNRAIAYGSPWWTDFDGLFTPVGDKRRG
jgi:hypothetical protein